MDWWINCEITVGRHVRHDVLDRHHSPCLNAIKRAINPVQLLDYLWVPYRVALLDKLVAYHSQASVHRIRVGILSEVVAEVVHHGCHSRGLFT